MSAFSTALPGTTIRTREQLNAVVENIVLLRRELAELNQAQANEIAAVREKYSAPLTEVDRFLQMETAWVETWARHNPTELGAGRLLECPHALIGFRDVPPRVERASRRWTWTEAVTRLSEVEWGEPYLRIPEPEVNKEAILADLAKLDLDDLHEVGIKIVQGERFFLEPHGQEKDESSPGDDWQEAA